VILLLARFGEERAEEIAQFIQYNTHNLEEIDFGQNYINPEGVKWIAEAIKQNSTLLEIELVWNMLGGEGMVYSNNEKLIEKKTWIGAQGAKYIGEAIMVNSTLQKINIGNNFIGDEGVKWIADAIKGNNCTLRVIILRDNYIRENGAQCLADAIKENHLLREIDLSNNFIGDDGTKYIAESIKENTTLREIYLSNNIMEMKELNGLVMLSRRIPRYRSLIFREINLETKASNGLQKA
jgi:Ran GTPase-activating protein (RanGAP) involved in mRNA processing and transport